MVRLLDPVTRKQTRSFGVGSNEEAVRKAPELASAHKGKVAVVQA